MSTMIVVLAVEDMVADPLGIKETIAMDMEKYGGVVRVLRVNVQAPEQIGLCGNGRSDFNGMR